METLYGTLKINKKYINDYVRLELFFFQGLSSLSEHLEQVNAKLSSLRKLKKQLDSVTSWVNETLTRINISKELPPTEKSRIISNIMVR